MPIHHRTKFGGEGGTGKRYRNWRVRTHLCGYARNTIVRTWEKPLVAVVMASRR